MRLRPPERTIAAAALCGVAAAVVGLAVGQLVALLSGADSAPVVAVGDAVVDHVPLWLKESAISLFGTSDKTVLIAGVVLALLALAALAGVLERRRPPWGAWLVLALGAVAALAALTRPDAGMLAIVPAVVAALAGVWVLRLLLRRTAVPRPASDPVAGPVGSTPNQSTPNQSTPSRRNLLALPLLAALGGLAVWGGARLLGTRTQGGTSSRAEVKLPPAASPEPPLPADVEVGVNGVAPFRVPNPDFYRIDTALVVPQVDAGTWRLRIHGMVDREVSLDYAQILASPLVERDVTLMCVSNEVGGDLIGNARWLGLPIAPLLAQAGPQTHADMILSTSADGFTCSTPLEVLTDGRDALLAVGMNGEPLPVEHGFPVRMVVPGLYGFVSATKWVVDLEVTRFDRAQAYWTSRGWAAKAPVKTGSRIDVPRAGGRVKAGRAAVAGVAWAQHRGVEAVQVRIDGGAWQPCELAQVPRVDGTPTKDTWRQWVYRWDATPGSHQIQVRASDGTGAVQTGQQAPPPPDGATGWHTIHVDVGS